MMAFSPAAERVAHNRPFSMRRARLQAAFSLDADVFHLIVQLLRPADLGRAEMSCRAWKLAVERVVREQAAAWGQAAAYLCARVHAPSSPTPPSNPGRAPDMGEAAAAAFCGVLREVGLARDEQRGSSNACD